MTAKPAAKLAEYEVAKPSPKKVLAEYQASTGQIRTWLAAPGVVRVEIRGHFSAGMERQHFIEPCNALLRSGEALVLFDDWEEMTGYDTSVRMNLTQWSIANRTLLPTHHILVRSKIVAMGVATAGLALKLAGTELRSYTLRSEFEASFGAAMPGGRV